MENLGKIKVSEMEGLSYHAAIFMLAYLRVRKDIFGNYDGYRRGGLRNCFYEYQNKLPECLCNTHPGDWPFEVMPWRNQRIRDYVERFDVIGVESEIKKTAKLIRPYILGVEIGNFKKAIAIINARKNLPAFSKERAKLKKLLE